MNWITDALRWIAMLFGQGQLDSCFWTFIVKPTHELEMRNNFYIYSSLICTTLSHYLPRGYHVKVMNIKSNFYDVT